MKQWLSRLPIRGKLMLLAAIATCVALLISGAVLVHYAYGSSEQALRHRLETQARITALNSSAALAFEDMDAARSTLQALAGDAAILGAEIERLDGTPFVEHAFGTRSVAALHTAPDIVHATADITLGDRLGRVHLLATESELRTLLWRSLVILVLAASVSLLVALLAASRLQRIISDPILALAETAEAVSKTHDYTLQVATTTQDEVGQLVGAFNDMLAKTHAQGTELRIYQAELEHKVERRTAELASALKDATAAAQAKADFLANMSHEIRTPMNGVIGMLDLMDGEGLDPQRRGMLETARNSAESLLGIINDVLDFSKIDAGKLTLEEIDVELLPLAEEVSTLFARQAHANNVEVTCLVESSVPSMIRGDPVRLRQILANLLGNAVKFTEHGEVSLTVRTRAVNSGRVDLEVAIRDTGIGMSSEAVSRLFQSFTQADTSTTRRFGGTGLGLAITRRLIDAMGGTIAVQSEPGKGSTFTVNIPALVGSAVSAPRRADLSGIKLLVVDDNATNRLVLQHYLHSLRIEHRSAASAQEGLSLARHEAAAGKPFDMIVLDYHMPDIDGFGFLRQLRADPAVSQSKCIVLSSMGDRQVGAETLEISAWLNKPVRQSQLYSAIAMVAGVSAGWNAVGAAADAMPAPRAFAMRFDARVLLVEDNAVNQQVASRMLAAFGLNAQIAVNGWEAVERIKAERFDLVFMDCQMPLMDGYQAARAVREWENVEGRTRLPIVAMTANAMQGDREKCLDAGMDDYVSKPVKRDSLAAVLSRWLTKQDVPRVERHEDAPRDTVDGHLDLDAFDQLQELFDGDPEPIVESYLHDSLLQLDTMANAAAQIDLAALERGAHSLKASSRSIGARRVGNLAERLESLARGEYTSDEAKALIAKLRIARAQLEPQLRRVCDEARRKSA